jgi:Na+-transporting methylmalonyl-CoA/oxaloacetate decarboxylase gamma subunit
MKRKNREIVTFGISAIDLFCSGMGAVMLLMVLLMPYYMRPVTSSMPVPVPSPEPVPIPAPTPEPVPAPAPAPDPGIKVRSTDVVFVMDATASMQFALESVRSSMRSIVQVLRRLSEDVTIGFVAYIDRSVLLAIPLKTVAAGPVGEANLRDLMRGIGSVRLVGNYDWPEDVSAGLTSAFSMNWPTPSQDRRQLVVVMGDAETHPEDRQFSFQSVRKWVAVSEERSVHAVNTFTLPGRGPEFRAARNYFSEIARIGRGKYIESEGELLGVILDILIVR